MKHTFWFLILHFLGLAAPAPNALAQRAAITEAPDTRAELGRPFLRNYSPKEFRAAPSNWAIVQDHRGVMYFGNAEGVLEYDGVAWRRIATPNRTVVRSLALDSNGRVYVGEVGTFGYLAPDSLGHMRFVSLLEHVPVAERKFADVWKTRVTKHGVYFITYNKLFRYNPRALPPPHGVEGDVVLVPEEERDAIRVWKAQTRFQFAFVVRDTLYVDQRDRGLMQMAGDSLRLVPGGERFAAQRISVMLPQDERRILIGAMAHGLYLLEGKTIHPFPTEVDSFLIQNQLYHGIPLPEGGYALATIRGGAVIIDKQGRLLQRVDKTAGLQDNFVLALHADQQSGLWLALSNGVARVEAPAPLSIFGEGSGLMGGVVAITRHQGVLYAATSLGVFYLNPAQPQTAAFQPVAGIATQCWSFLSHGEDLLVASNEGVYRISKDRIANLGARGAIALHRSRQDRNRIFVGLTFGLGLLHWNEHKWIDAGKIPGIEEEIRSIAEGEEGTLWLGTKSQGILRVSLPSVASATAAPRLERFGLQQGLPEGEINAHFAAGRFFFVSAKGVFRFEEAARRFLPDSTLGSAFAQGKAGVEVLASDRRGNVWLVAKQEDGDEINLLQRQPDESFRRVRAPFLRVPKTALWAVYPEDGSNEIVWCGGAEGLVRYDHSVQKNYAAPYSTLIRRVIVDEDSVIFGGAEFVPPVFEKGQAEALMKLPYGHNAWRFEFAAASFEAEAENQFQTFLEGFDEHWSAWSKESKRDYTNLPKGEYRFRVRARNVYERLGAEGVYAFHILPPWYRTWWAYGFYAALFAAAAFAADRIQRRRLLKKERERAQLREARLRAEAENERRKNIELLSEIGKEITASLDMDTIFNRLYEHVNQLVDAAIFGVGIFHPEKEQIEYRLAIEKGKRYAPYTRDTRDKNQFPVWCIEQRELVFINDVAQEHGKYVRAFKSANVTGAVLEDGTLPQEPLSIIYLPLISQEKVLGVISIQSFQKNAYTEYHLNLLQNLAAYTSIALDNADAYRRLDATLQNLQATQQQLVTQQKLASLGQLTAGIAHEIKNPLNFVNNFAALSVDLAKELREEVAKIEEGELKISARESLANVEEIVASLIQNAEKINQHGKRADDIVQSMMQHARGSSGRREPTDLNHLLEGTVNLVYHGLRAQDASFNLTLRKEYDGTIGKINVVPQNMSRVFLNIINNACYAALQKQKANGDDSFAPTLSVATKNLGGQIEIRIRDNGNGIPPEIREKIFHPFFTTKPAGQGTGLGLSISYDIIVHEHKGELEVETEEGKFTEFVVRLPKNG